MLVLTRKPGEKVVLGGGITVTVLEAARDRVRIGVEAPDDVFILPGELACWVDPDGGTTEEEPAGLLADVGGLATLRDFVHELEQESEEWEAMGSP
jgi:carbon storage regulator